MKTHPKQKLYCYVDETGQDTGGDIFLVAVVVTADKREALRGVLEAAEEQSGKRSNKWSRSTRRQRTAYIQSVFGLSGASFYYSAYHDTRQYVDLTILSVAKAINTYTPQPYSATILVDGLQRSEQHRFARGLRKLRIHTRKVRGMNDQSDVFIRLADALAGFVRDALEEKEGMKELYLAALRNNTIREV